MDLVVACHLVFFFNSILFPLMAILIPISLNNVKDFREHHLFICFHINYLWIFSSTEFPAFAVELDVTSYLHASNDW